MAPLFWPGPRCKSNGCSIRNFWITSASGAVSGIWIKPYGPSLKNIFRPHGDIVSNPTGIRGQTGRRCGCHPGHGVYQGKFDHVCNPPPPPRRSFSVNRLTYFDFSPPPSGIDRSLAANMVNRHTAPIPASRSFRLYVYIGFCGSPSGTSVSPICQMHPGSKR